LKQQGGFMHRISDEVLHKAQEHALLSQQHGDQMRSIAKRLQQAGRLSEDQRRQVEQCGKLMQQFAQEGLDALDTAYKYPKDSVDMYAVAADCHVQANQQYLIAMQILLNIQQNLHPQ
jgi:hypothetical protein